jgi:hypothetical protein
MSASDGNNQHRGQSTDSIESDDSSTATTKTAIKTCADRSNEVQDEEPALETRNPFQDEDEELEDIQLGEEIEAEQNGHVEETSSVEPEDQLRVESSEPSNDKQVDEEVKVTNDKRPSVPLPLSPLRQTVHNPELAHTTTLDSSNESVEQALERLHIGIKTKNLSNKEIVDGIFNLVFFCLIFLSFNLACWRAI